MIGLVTAATTHVSHVVQAKIFHATPKWGKTKRGGHGSRILQILWGKIGREKERKNKK